MSSSNGPGGGLFVSMQLQRGGNRPAHWIGRGWEGVFFPVHLNHSQPSAQHSTISILKSRILGKKYELSVVLCGDAFSQKLNRKHRGHNRPTNILSFTLDELSGELVLNASRAEQEAKTAKVPIAEYVLYLLAHGMLHLRGHDHGPKMEEKERVILKPLVSREFLEWMRQ